MPNPFRQEDIYQYSNPYRSYGKINREKYMGTRVKGSRTEKVKKIDIAGKIPRSKFSTYYPVKIK